MTDPPQVLAIREGNPPARLTNSAKRAASAEAGRPTPHWGLDQVLALAEAARRRGRSVKGQPSDDHRHCRPFEGYPVAVQETGESKALDPNWGYAPCSYPLDGSGPP